MGAFACVKCLISGTDAESHWDLGVHSHVLLRPWSSALHTFYPKDVQSEPTNLGFVSLTPTTLKARWRLQQTKHAVCPYKLTSCRHSDMHVYHDRRVSGSVLRDDNVVALLFPLWRLVFDIGDGDCELHRTVSTSPIGCYDVTCDVSPLW